MAIPAGFKRLPDGTRCRCARLHAESDGSHWCCDAGKAPTQIEAGQFSITVQTSAPDGQMRSVTIKSDFVPPDRWLRVDYDVDRNGFLLLSSAEENGPFIEIGFTALED